jgi:hypothetical protein
MGCSLRASWGGIGGSLAFVVRAVGDAPRPRDAGRADDLVIFIPGQAIHLTTSQRTD